MNDAEIEQFSKEHGFAAWYRVSAKEGTRVRMVMVMMILMVQMMILIMIMMKLRGTESAQRREHR